MMETTIRLSARGWGDYSPLVWTGDITRTDNEILAECRELLIRGHDVDNRNQSDDEILAKINAARKRIADAPAREAARQRELEADEAHRAMMRRVMRD